MSSFAFLSLLVASLASVQAETPAWLTQFYSNRNPRPRDDGARYGRCDMEGSYPIYTSTASRNRDDRFVTVEGTKLLLGCQNFKFGGSNTYQLMELGYDGSSGKDRVKNLLDEHLKLGMKVIRTWTFSYDASKALQWGWGSYNEEALRSLDFAVSEAGKRNLKLIIALGDMWCEPEGVNTMVSWCGGSREGDFYTLQSCKDMYKDRISKIVERINTVTGVAYKDDPTIMAWDIINEARFKNAGHCTLRQWFSEMAAYIKTVDENHLVTTGEEGFYSTTSEGYWVNPDTWSPDEGQDFVADHKISRDIDFLTIHLWPDNWLDNGISVDDKVKFALHWIDVHIRQASELRMPLVVEEFGKIINDNENVAMRDSIFTAVYDAVEESSSSGGPVVGSLFWYLSDQTYSDPEGWSRGGYDVAMSDRSTLNLVERHSRFMSDLGESESKC